jgi:hypothetical protein
MKQLIFFFTLIFFLFSGNQNVLAGAYNPDNKLVTKSSLMEKKVTGKIQQAEAAIKKLQKKAVFSPNKENQRSHNYLGGAIKVALLSAIFFAITFVTSGTVLTIMLACSVIALTVALILFGLWLYNSI